MRQSGVNHGCTWPDNIAETISLLVPKNSSAWVPARIVELDLSPTLTTELAPLFAVFAPLHESIVGITSRRWLAA